MIFISRSCNLNLTDGFGLFWVWSFSRASPEKTHQQGVSSDTLGRAKSNNAWLVFPLPAAPRRSPDQPSPEWSQSAPETKAEVTSQERGPGRTGCGATPHWCLSKRAKRRRLFKASACSALCFCSFSLNLFSFSPASFFCTLKYLLYFSISSCCFQPFQESCWLTADKRAFSFWKTRRRWNVFIANLGELC